MFFRNYFAIFVFLLASIILSTIIFFLSFFLSAKLDDAEKLTAYECGFSPFSDSRTEFDIKFYIVAILLHLVLLKNAYLLNYFMIHIIYTK